jgi:hypothetical protein
VSSVMVDGLCIQGIARRTLRRTRTHSTIRRWWRNIVSVSNHIISKPARIRLQRSAGSWCQCRSCSSCPVVNLLANSQTVQKRKRGEKDKSCESENRSWEKGARLRSKHLPGRQQKHLLTPKISPPPLLPSLLSLASKRTPASRVTHHGSHFAMHWVAAEERCSRSSEVLWAKQSMMKLDLNSLVEASFSVD